MKIKDITAAIEAFAPLSAQEGFDNSGLIVGDREAGVQSALLCVDITESVMEEAVRLGAGLVVSHHPIIFNPLRRITGSNYVERVVATALRHGIALYGCHTNLDAVQGGLSYRLAEMIGLRDVRLLAPTKDEKTGFGVVGTLAKPCGTVELLETIADILSIKSLRYSAPVHDTITRVAVCSGSGASQIPDAIAAGAELFLAADFKYNHFLDAGGRITIADIGHFESEYCAIDLLYGIISEKFPTFAVRKSENSVNPVNYLI